MAPGPGHDIGPFVRNIVKAKVIINIKSNINPVTGSVNDVIGGISLNLLYCTLLNTNRGQRPQPIPFTGA